MARPFRTLGAVLAALLLLAVPWLEAQARERGARAGRARSERALPPSGSSQREVTRTGPAGESRTSTHTQRWERSGGTFTKEGTHTGAGGRSATTRSRVERTDDGYRKEKSWTGPEGRTATREATGAYDAQSRTWTREGTTTGPQGRTVTDTHTATRTEDGWQRHDAVTGPEGRSATRDVTGTRDPETGSWAKDVTTTGPGGGVTTRQVEGVRTDDGYQRSVTTVGPQGGVTTRSATGSYDAETRTFTREGATTGPDGRTATDVHTTTRTENGVEHRDAWTGPEGRTATREVTGGYDPATGTATRDATVTGPGGRSASAHSETVITPDDVEAPPAP